jgi:hypothetical protein
MNETLQQTTDQMRFCRQIELMSQGIVLKPLNNIESMLDMVIQPPSSKPRRL